MAASLPYLATPGSIKTALERIRTAATPDRVTKDFVTTKLQIRGGTGAAISAFLKKIGLVAPDGTPTDLYKRFRNKSTGGSAIADAIKHGYKELAQVNEYFFELSDKDLLALIVQVTGTEENSSVVKLTLSTLKTLKGFADFEAEAQEDLPEVTLNNDTLQVRPSGSGAAREQLGLNLSYTINLNLPATSDQAVFNAIFRSLKEHLLSND